MDTINILSWGRKFALPGDRTGVGIQRITQNVVRKMKRYSTTRIRSCLAKLVYVKLAIHLYAIGSA